LEFSDQEDFSDGPREVRVPPPPGFVDDLALIGSKFDPTDPMEKEHNPEIAKMKKQAVPQQQPQQQQQLVNPLLAAALAAQQQRQTPSLPAFNPLASLTPEQIQQLALLQYLQNPFGGLAGLPNLASPAPPKPQQAAAKPVIRTETIYATSTIPLHFGNKEIFTTITSAVGVTTVTEYEQQQQQVQQQTLPPPALPVAPAYNPLAAAAALQPSFTVTSRPVVQNTVIPSTITKEIRITFRNVPTLTTLTSTTMVSTQVTSYVTQTVTAAPSLNAGGFGLNPLAALLG